MRLNGALDFNDLRRVSFAAGAISEHMRAVANCYDKLVEAKLYVPSVKMQAREEYDIEVAEFQADWTEYLNLKSSL